MSTFTSQNVVIVRATSTGLSYPAGGTPSSLDGVPLIAGETVLLKDQQSPNLPNGLYTWNSGSFTQLANFPSYTAGDLCVIVTRGQQYSSTQWTVSSDSGVEFVARLPGFTTQTVPAGLQYGYEDSPTYSNERYIQIAINQLLQYDQGINSAAANYWKFTDTTATGTVSISGTDGGTLFRASPGFGNTVTFNLGTGSALADQTIYFALMGDINGIGVVSFTGSIASNNISGFTPGSLVSRFQEATAKWNHLTSKWTLADAYVTSGGTVYLPGGTIYINGFGIKLHPAVNLFGQNVGATILSAGSNLTGKQDLDIRGTMTKENPGLLTVCAREPLGPNGTAAGGGDMFNPTIQNIKILGNNIGTTIGDVPRTVELVS